MPRKPASNPLNVRGPNAPGFIDKRKMRESPELRQAEIDAFDSEKIKGLRRRFNISQAVLASLLNTSVGTVRHWEISLKHPSGPSLKLLNLLDQKGLSALLP